MNAYLEILRGSPEFQEVLTQIKKKRPIIPAYNASEDNTEAWKSNSLMLQGFNLCLTYFEGKAND